MTILRSILRRRQNRFRGQTNGAIANGINPHQKKLLRKFFGKGLKEALESEKNFRVPEGLSRDTLERYREIARRVIEKGKDPSGVQRVRLRLVKRALGQMEN